MMSSRNGPAEEHTAASDSVHGSTGASPWLAMEKPGGTKRIPRLPTTAARMETNLPAMLPRDTSIGACDPACAR